MSDQKSSTSVLEQIAMQLSDSLARNKALELQNKTLRERLDQRFQATVRAFDSSAFDSMRALIVQMFFKLEPTAMLTMEELKDEFETRYPNVNSANVPRRVFELSQPDGRFGHKLGRKSDPDGTVRYFLWLKEEPVQVGVLEETVSQ